MGCISCGKCFEEMTPWCCKEDKRGLKPMKYRITVDIEADKKLSPSNLQRVKSVVEETVIENMQMPGGANIFVNSKVTKESN